MEINVYHSDDYKDDPSENEFDEFKEQQKLFEYGLELLKHYAPDKVDDYLEDYK